MPAKMSQSEHSMYAPITKLFKKKGYSVISEPGGFHINSVNRRVDVLAFRWEGDSIHTIGVEAKKARASSALAEGSSQATDYQSFFDEVYIAGEGQADVDHTVFTDKNLGYIALAQAGDIAEINIACPTRTRIKDQQAYGEEIQPRLAMLLSFKEVIQRSSFPNGTYDKGRAHAAVDLYEKAQINVDYDPNPRKREVKAGINIQEKKTLRMIFGNTPIDFSQRFFEVLKKLPPDYVFCVYRREGLRAGEAVDADTSCVRIGDLNARILAAKFRKIRSLLGVDKRLSPHFHLYSRLWSADDVLMRGEYVERVRIAYDELYEIMKFLRSV